MDRKDDYDIISMSSRDVYSSSGKNIASSSDKDIYSSRRVQETPPPRRPTPQQRKKRRKKKKARARVIKIIVALVLISAVACGAFYAYGYSIIDKIDRESLNQNDLGITTDSYAGVKNIALLGIDTHDDNDTGRSDAVVVMSIDKKHKKIKLTSIARDTYVAIDGHNRDKLTHAYAYGRSQLAVKTLNQNFGLEITDYVTVNFFEFARIIDYIGGVTVDVDEAERVEMNTNIIPFLVEMGIACEPVGSAGVQLLTGGQAVCYARIRHTDSDVERGNRQKEVLTAMFTQVKHMNPLRIPSLAAMIVAECKTSLPTSEIMSMGMWALTRSPEFEQMSMPNENVPSAGKTIRGVWYYVYDLDVASKEMRAFIEETGYYAPKQVAARAAGEKQ